MSHIFPGQRVMSMGKPGGMDTPRTPAAFRLSMMRLAAWGSSVLTTWNSWSATATDGLRTLSRFTDLTMLMTALVRG
jgi:hypothetical protein